MPTAQKKKVVVLTGAGISAESGIRTFRDSGNGLWGEFKIEEVCTADAWEANPEKVNEFYNLRRLDVLNAEPNKAHIDLAAATEYFDIKIITTNVDDLHERAGSKNVLHLHGHILKARSDRLSLSVLPEYLLEPHLVSVGRKGIQPFEQAPDGNRLRPHVVFFGEDVPEYENAFAFVQEADAIIVVGTSLSVYPAAGLTSAGKDTAPVIYVDPSAGPESGMYYIAQPATTGVEAALTQLKKTFGLDATVSE